MTFELDAGGVHISCSSPSVTKKLIEKGARLVDESQRAHLDGEGGDDRFSPRGSALPDVVEPGAA